MNLEEIKFIAEQKDTIEGSKWISFLESYIEKLYNVKGVPLDKVLSRQQAAEHLEKIIAHSKDEPPKLRNNEYR